MSSRLESLVELGLQGKVAVITGGSERIGRATAFRFSEEGVRVAICARREAVLQRTVERFGRLDILVNNAGHPSAMSFEKATDEVWQEDIEVKLYGAIRCTRMAIPHMRKQGGGRIINMTTIAGKQPGARAVPTSV